MPWYYLSSTKMTVAVRVEGNRIVEAAPIVRRFLGQPPERLGIWMRRQGGFVAKKL